MLFHNSINFFNKKNSINKKKNFDDSEQYIFNNNNIKKNNSIKQITNNVVLTNGKNVMNKRKSKIVLENKGKISKSKLIYYYILPLWLLKRKKSFNNIYSIKDRICGYFSIEKIHELIKFKENLEYKSFKSKLKSIEHIKINSKNYDKTSSYDNKNKNIIPLN